MTDREKFDAWVAACPVTLRDVKLFAFGYVEVHVEITDERMEDADPPEDLRDEWANTNWGAPV